MRIKGNRVVSLLLCFVLLSSTFSFALNRSVAKSEFEPNNTFAQANQINQDDTVYAYISSATDVDYFKVVFPISGTVNFWIGEFPGGKDYDLYVYKNNYTLLGSSTTGTTQEKVTLTVSSHLTYYMKVVSHNGTYSSSSTYQLRSRIYPNHTYYNQWYSNSHNSSYNDTNMNILYYKVGNSLSSETWKYKMQNYGCYMSSLAMILKNLGSVTDVSYYDIRTGNTSMLQADPFSVAYANVLFPSVSTTTLGGNTVYVANTTSNPVYTNIGNIASGFGETCTMYSLSGLSQLNKAKAISYQLTLHPEGVAIVYSNSSGQHMAVVMRSEYEVPAGYVFPLTGTVYTCGSDCSEEDLLIPMEPSAEQVEELYKTRNDRSSAYDSLFIVCDPSGYVTNYDYDMAELGDTYGGSVFGFGSIIKIYVFN